MTRRLACMSSCLKLYEGSASASSEDPSIISGDDHHCSACTTSCAVPCPCARTSREVPYELHVKFITRNERILERTINNTRE